jgi:phage-related protein
MFYIVMSKKIFHNDEVINLDKVIKQSPQYDQKKTVNINVLLNKVKLDNKKELRQRCIFFIGVSALVLMIALLLF